MMLEPCLVAPVLAQPSLPLDAPDEIESSYEEAAQIRARLQRDDVTVLAYRFERDQFCQTGEPTIKARDEVLDFFALCIFD